MKQDPNFIVSDVAGRHILMPIGRKAASFDGMIALNDMGLTIWELLREERAYGELLQQILAEFDVDRETADRDARAFLDRLLSVGAIVDQGRRP